MRRLGVGIVVAACAVGAFAVPAAASPASDTDDRGAATPRSSRAPYRASVPTRYPVYALQHLEPSFWLDNPKIRFHSDGSLWFGYGSRYGAGWRFNPVTTAQYCLAQYNRWAVDGASADARRAVIRTANGLLRRAEAIGSGIGWRYGFPQSSFGADPGWISGMAQGQAMGCLAGAARVTGDRRFAREALRAHRVLVAPFGDDGTAVRAGRGTFYEEVAGDDVRPAHILNGHLFALAGIHLANELDPRRVYDASFAAGVAAVRSLVTLYYAGVTSLYDLGPRRLALPGEYNLVHAMGMRWLADLTEDPWLHGAALRFQSYERVVPLSARMTSGGRSRTVNVGGRSVVEGSRPARIDLTLGEETTIDRIFLATRDGDGVPASVRVVSGGRAVRVRPSRFMYAALPARSVRTIAIEVRPREGRRFSLRLVAPSGPASRSLTATSSDLSALYPIAGDQVRALRYLTDGRTSTVFRTATPGLRVAIEIGAARFERVRLTLCPQTHGDAPATYAFGGAGRWSDHRPLPAATRRVVELDVRGRALELRWDPTTLGCLAEVEGLDPRVPV